MDNMLKSWAKTDGTILLLGETGVGKSYIAKEIHKVSGRDEYPFVVAHLASIYDELFESELFGHVKGAFTGAEFDKVGYVEAACGGTLFLDEIGELSLKSQKKLLFLLEERKYSKVGSNKDAIFSGRMIAATNMDLKKMVKEGSFREDLYFRLMVFTKELLPIREDKNKLKKVIETCFNSAKSKYLREDVVLVEQLRSYLINEYMWPGNRREIINVMDYLVNCGNSILGIKDLPSWVVKKERDASNSLKGKDFQIAENNLSVLPQDYHAAIDIFEKIYLLHQLRSFSGRVNYTAKVLQMSKSTLIAKIRKYGINIWQIKADLHKKKVEMTSPLVS